MRPPRIAASTVVLFGWLLLLGAAGVATAAITANFDDGTYGDLDVLVDVSDTSVGTTLAALATHASYGDHGLVDADLELYNKGGGGSGGVYYGGDKALIDTDEAFTDVVVTGVVGMTATSSYGAAGAGLAAGMAAAGDSGYLLYLASWWNKGEGYFVQDAAGTTGPASSEMQLILTRKDAAMNTPLNGVALSDVATVPKTHDVPHFLRLTVSGNTVTGEVWLNQESAVGAADATVTFTDASVLGGHVGAYLAIGYYGCNTPAYGNNYGLAAVDDFQADAIPEPATMGLLGLGCAGLAVIRRRRRTVS